MSVAGIVGTPLGGVLLDVYTRRRKRHIIETDQLLTAQLGLLSIGALKGAVSLSSGKTIVAAAGGATEQPAAEGGGRVSPTLAALHSRHGGAPA